MAKLRKFAAYIRLERPYTRISKYRKKAYIRTTYPKTIVRFDMGDPKGKYPYRVELLSKKGIQMRDHALESARQTSIRLLEGTLGTTGYYLKVNIFPHHILRENPLAAGAGADRFSTGMTHSFGKPIGAAARVQAGQTILTIDIDKANLPLAKKAMLRASHKLPCSCWIKITENKQ